MVTDRMGDRRTKLKRMTDTEKERLRLGKSDAYVSDIEGV